MKKLPALFKREIVDHVITKVYEEITPGMEWFFEGKGEATIKLDGACCAVINGVFYKRYDCKGDKLPPEGSIECDAKTEKHWVHWVPVKEENSCDKWLLKAYENAKINGLDVTDGTFEAIGPHFQKNPYLLKEDILIKHGILKIDVERSYDGVKSILKNNSIEGLVFWKDGEAKCKITRSDFGFKWPDENAEHYLHEVFCSRPDTKKLDF